MIRLSDWFKGRPKKPKRALPPLPSAHQTNTAYLIGVPQVPAIAAQLMGRGNPLSDELEAECDKAIEAAREEIKRVAPLRSERFYERYKRPIKLFRATGRQTA